MRTKEQRLKDEIRRIGGKLYGRSLVVAKSGNLSCRLDRDTMLITASGTCLGALKERDIVRVDIRRGPSASGIRPSSEYPLHSMIYRNFACSRVIHCHPPLTNAYFAVYPRLADLIFETRHTIGDVPVVKQFTVTVTRPAPVIAALGKNRIVVLKNHGVVSIDDDFSECFYRIEALESAVQVAAAARLFNNDILDDIDTCLKKKLKKSL
ncbi:MAG TPA: class II aldolase/adducin family protein [Candidatus Omnitrophota bacterium]|nr:class II aldolase/adducin family protein [Candidatus Omnitrophota bacterium]HQJ14906.1 class II aldolase/adducin family protein [Candidatus Omnitrophota bacterium]